MNSNTTGIGTAAAAVDTSATQTATQTAAPAAGANGAASVGTTTSTNGADFGLCNPTMKFEGGLGGRPGEPNSILNKIQADNSSYRVHLPISRSKD